MLLDRIPETAEAVHQYLASMPVFRKDGVKAANLKLEEIRLFLAALGNPHHGKKFIHVGGTNGKGSTSAMLASIYQEAGYKTGLYTSPHVTTYNERFKINGKNISDRELLAFFQENGDILSRIPHTYFELATAICFWWFAREAADVSIVEVGLGGRLDATNIIDPLCAVITSIGMDHMEILGPDIPHIAAEKAGIIKTEKPVVFGNVSGEASDVLRMHAQVKRAPFYEAAALKPRWKQGRVVLNNGYPAYECGLVSSPQSWNTAACWLATGLLQKELPVPESAFRDGIKNVVLYTGLAGRFERLKKDRKWYFDGGHNAEALLETCKTIKNVLKEQNPVLIFSMMRDKVTNEALEPFFEFEEIWYYSMESERAASFAEFAAVVGHARHLDGLTTLTSIVHQHPSRCVVFLGSFYFYRTVSQWLENC